MEEHLFMHSGDIFIMRQMQFSHMFTDLGGTATLLLNSSGDDFIDVIHMCRIYERLDCNVCSVIRLCPYLYKLGSQYGGRNRRAKG